MMLIVHVIVDIRLFLFMASIMHLAVMNQELGIVFMLCCCDYNHMPLVLHSDYKILRITWYSCILTLGVDFFMVFLCSILNLSILLLSLLV